MIKTGLFGETGANPVRARRRKAHMITVDLTESHSFGKSHWSISEKAGQRSAKSKYPDRSDPQL